MQVDNFMAYSLYSLRKALNTAALEKSMNRDAASMSKLLASMEKTTSDNLEKLVTPHRGQNIDVRV